MANHLTGDFDAVVQIAVRQLNGLLASLHQDGATADASLRLPHTTSVRVGDPPRRPPDVGVFGDWVMGYQTTRPPVDIHDLRAQLTGMAPPGAARRFEDTFGRFDEVFIPPDVIRGIANLQLSSPTVSLPEGSTSEITIHTHVRGHYSPDPDTHDLPAPIHGEVRAVFEVRQTQGGGGRKLLITPSPDSSKIQFIAAPGSGLSAAAASQIAAQVVKALRESFTLVPVDLPADFAFADFKGVGSGGEQAVALPLQLSDLAPPAGGVQNLVTSFVGTGGFAFGIGKEFVEHVFQPTIDQLLLFRRDVTVPIPLAPDPTYHFSVTGVTLEFNDQTIDLVIRGKATHRVLPDFQISIRQRFALRMRFDTLSIVAGHFPPEVSGLPGPAVEAVKAAIISVRDAALPPAQDALNQQLSGALTRLNAGLRSFSPTAAASFRVGFSENADAGTSGGIAVTPDGIILRGDISTVQPATSGFVEITEVQRGRTYSALNSWIPGGRIERLVWSWVERSATVGFGGHVNTHTDDHRFLLSIPTPQPGPGGARVIGEVCLRIEGTRILPDGSVQPSVAGAACHVPEPEVVMEVPSWWEPVHVPIWLPELSDSVIAKDAIAGHVTVQTDIPRKDQLTRNSLVHFADWNSGDPLAVISSALARMDRKSVSLAVIVVVPVGAFGVSRRELERKLAALTERFSFPVQVTEDDEGGWTRTFGVSKVPSTYLINAKREFVWSDTGNAESSAMALALDRHLTPAPIAKARPLRLSVSAGDRAPDALFRTDRDEQIALHRMRGRSVVLNFWQPWSAPCLKELSRLQKLHEGRGKESPVIMGFHGGKNPKDLAEIRAQLGLSFTLAHDSNQQIARAYGVRCWPTTVSIAPGGEVEHIQFGLASDRVARHDGAESTAG